MMESVVLLANHSLSILHIKKETAAPRIVNTHTMPIERVAVAVLLIRTTLNGTTLSTRQTMSAIVARLDVNITGAPGFAQGNVVPRAISIPFMEKVVNVALKIPSTMGIGVLE